MSILFSQMSKLCSHMGHLRISRICLQASKLCSQMSNLRISRIDKRAIRLVILDVTKMSLSHKEKKKSAAMKAYERKRFILL